MIKTRNFIISIFLLLIIWQLIVLIGRHEEALFPAPLIVFKALIALTVDGSLYIHLKDSLFRFGIGYTLAAISAVILGLLLGRSKILWMIIDPVVQLLRPISPVAWSPFIVLWFGIGNLPAIVIIFIATFFPILLTTINGVKSTEEHYLKLAANFQFNNIQLFQKFIFPAALPSIISGLHIAIGTGWIFLVAGEMVGSQSGLGYLIVDARNTLNLDVVLAGIIVIGVCGFLLDRLITTVEIVIKKYTGFIV